MGAKHHRFPREHYQGRVWAAFTLCIQDQEPLFTKEQKEQIVRIFVDFLKTVAEKHTFRAIYCFMPDHSHLILLGTTDHSDVLRGVEKFKQRTGYWLKTHYPLIKWQKGFHDRIIRDPELGNQVRYVLDNPVRRGLVDEWRKYSFTGAIGMDLETFLEELGPD